MGLAEFYHIVFAAVWAVHYCCIVLTIGVPILAVAERLLKVRTDGKPGGKAWHFLRGPYPICLSLTITTGVAPLLFGQVLFHRVFYQALIVMYPLPLIGLGLLIAYFYISYLVKHVDRLALPLAVVQVVMIASFALFFGLLFNCITKGSAGLVEDWWAHGWPPWLWHSLLAHVIVSVGMSVFFLKTALWRWWWRALPMVVVAGGVSAAREMLRANFGGEGVVPKPIADGVDISAVVFVIFAVVMVVVVYRCLRVAFAEPAAAEAKKQL